MRVVVLAAVMCVAAVSSAWAVDMGTFDDARLRNPDYNLYDGVLMSQARQVVTDAGVNIVVTDVVTPEFLDTVQIFCTSLIAIDLPSTEEVQAMNDWVQAGGILLVTADCY